MSAARKLVESSRPSPAPAPNPAALYESHLRFVWRNLRRFGVADGVLEDAVQDVFVAVHRRWESYDPHASSVETWLFGIVIRVAHSHRRALRRRLARLVPWFQKGPVQVAAIQDGPAEIVAKRQAALLLDRILDELREQHRQILVLVDVEQVSVTDAAKVLGINLSTAYTRLRVARLRFQDAVERLRSAERERGDGDE